MNPGLAGGSASGSAQAQKPGVPGSACGGEDPDLAAIVQAWPALPAAIRAGILAIIRSGGQA